MSLYQQKETVVRQVKPKARSIRDLVDLEECEPGKISSGSDRSGREQKANIKQSKAVGGEHNSGVRTEDFELEILKLEMGESSGLPAQDKSARTKMVSAQNVGMESPMDGCNLFLEKG